MPVADDLAQAFPNPYAVPVSDDVAKAGPKPNAMLVADDVAQADSKPYAVSVADDLVQAFSPFVFPSGKFIRAHTHFTHMRFPRSRRYRRVCFCGACCQTDSSQDDFARLFANSRNHTRGTLWSMLSSIPPRAVLDNHALL